MARRTRDRAAIYARFSSHNQRDESIEIQVENCRAYCEEHGLAVVGEYCDHAQTGRDTNRAAFQRMLADADRHLFDYVVIYKVTRIMRNRDEMALLRIQLARDGVEILYAGESIAKGSSGVLQLGMLEVLAEWESAILSERIRDGVHKNAERCLANGQQLYGWDIGADGRYVVNEGEAAVLRLARDTLFGGGTMADAVRAVAPYRTKRGATIRHQTLLRMLRRPQNVGTYTYAGVVVEGGMPALWSPEDQDRLEACMGSHRGPRRHKGQAHYPLTGKLWHEHGDGTAHGMSGRSATGSSGRTYYYYVCTGCGHRVRKGWVEEAVAGSVLEALSDEATRERIADMVCEAEAWEDDGPSQSEVIRGELAEIERAYENIWRAIERGVDPPGGKERVDALKERQALLERELRSAEAVEGMRLDRDAVLFWLESAAEYPPEQIIRLFVSRATLREDGTVRVVCLFEDNASSPASDGAGKGEFAQSAHGGGAENLGERVQIYPIRRGFVLLVR